MNDSKWATVLDALVTRRILCRIKLLWHRYADSIISGAPAIVCGAEETVILGYEFE